MPYIKQELREALNEDAIPYDAGDLNYVITTVCNRYLKQQGLKYKSINDIIGALECAKQEFYFRVARPYEDEKIIQNGDCY